MAFSTQNRKNEMRPLPMRITQLQFDRLVEARGRDGMAVQEHVRRALDLYLDKVERDALRQQVVIPLDQPPELNDRAAVGGPHEGIADVAATARELLAKDRAIRENRPVVRPR